MDEPPSPTKPCKKCGLYYDCTDTPNGCFTYSTKGAKRTQRNTCKKCELVGKKAYAARIKDNIKKNPTDLLFCNGCNVYKISDLFRNTRCKTCINERDRQELQSNIILPPGLEFESKECVTCHIRLPCTEVYFKKNQGTKAPLSSQCKACSQDVQNANRKINKQKLKDSSDTLTCKHCNDKKSACEFSTSTQCKVCVNNKVRHKRATCDPVTKEYNRLVANTRKRLYNAFKGYVNGKSNRTVNLLGCSFSNYLTYLHQYGYNNENNGLFDIDHIIPISLFDLNIKEQQFMCFHWMNTMPLLSHENRSKGNKIVPLQIHGQLTHLRRYCADNNLDLPQWIVGLYETLSIPANSS